LKFKTFYIIVILFLLNSCNSEKERKLDFDVSGIKLADFSIARYERDLFNLQPDHIKEGLQVIQQKYWIFLAADLEDTTNLNKIEDFITDPELINAFQETEKKFPDLNSLTFELGNALKYYKHYFPENFIPQVFTYVSGYQYEYPVQIADSAVIIGLDVYLGNDFKTYSQIGIPRYKIERMQPNYISIDCMKELALQLLPPSPKTTTFLDEIINLGKVMYFLDATLPKKEEFLKIGYSPEQLKWCSENERNLWAFIIDNQVLFSSDSQIIRKFTIDGPFTAAFSKEAPARLGTWFGWQIVRSYMNHHPDITLAELFRNTDNNLIFSQSKYKPLQ